MNLGFKRITSAVLSIVMIISSLVFVNVAGVYGAATESTWLATEAVPSWLSFNGFSSGQITSSSATASFKDAIFGSGETATGEILNQTAYINSKSDSTFTVTTTGENATLKIYAVRSSSNSGSSIDSVTGANGGVATTSSSVDIAGRNATTAIEAIDYSFDIADSYTFKFKNSGVAICKLVLTDEASASYTWTIVKTGLQNVNPDYVSIDESATGITNTLSYSGTDYVVKNSSLTADVAGVNLEGTVFTVNVTDDMFIPVTEGITISVANAGGKTLKLTGNTYNRSFSLVLDDNGSITGVALPQDTYTLSIDGGTLSYTSVEINSNTTAIDNVYTVNETVTFANYFNVSELSGTGNITETTLYANNYFKVLAKSADDTNNDVRIDNNSRTLNLANGETITSKYRINTQGGGSTSGRAVAFKTGDTAGKVYVYALSSNSTSERTLVLSDGSAEQTASVLGNTNSAATEAVFDVAANTEYFVYSTGGGSVIYYIGSTAELVAYSEEDATTEATTAEATTEATTAATTEATTEAPTEATTAPAGDYVAMGTYTLNSSTIGSTAKTGTYENMAYSVSEVNSSHMRVKSTDSITFTVAESASLTATFSNHGLVLKSGGATVATLTSGEAVHLDPYVEYTISGNSTSNTYLTSLEFVSSGVTRGTISGTVSYTDNAGTHIVSGIEVHYESGDGTVEGYVITDSNGKYTTPGLDAGAYTLTVYATDLYNEASTTATVTNGRSTTANITVTEKDTSQYDITFNVTNNSGKGNTVIIKAADTGNTVDETSVTWTDSDTSASVTLSLQTGSYTIELLDKTVGKIAGSTTFTVSSAGTVDIVVNTPDTIDLSALVEGTTYTFGTGNIEGTNEYFYVLGDVTLNSAYMALESRGNESITFYISGTQTIVINASNKSSTLTSVDGNKSYTVNNGKTTLELTEGYYTLNGASGTGIRLKTIEVLVTDTTEYGVTLSGNNNTGSPVTVSVNNAAGNTVATFTAQSGTFSENVTLTVGTYTLSTPSGSSVTNGDEFTVSADDTSFSDIVIDVDTSIDVPITVVGNTSRISITINGTSYNFAADSGSGNTITLDNMSSGANITFKFASSVANKITGWEGLDTGAYVQSSDSFNATATSAGFKFTYDPNAMTSSSAYGTSDSPLNYGNYGFGATKGTATGATQAENVAELNAVTGLVTLNDYMSGYKDGDERLILNNNQNTGVSFTAIGDGYVIIDSSYGPPKVTINGEAATLDTITSGKRGFEVKEGDKVEIHSGSTTSSRSVQLKSVRFQTDGNVFKLAVLETVNYDELTDDTKNLLTQPTAGNVLVRIIGTLNNADVDSSTVDGVGVLVMTQAAVEGHISTSGMFVPTNYVDTDEAITLSETDTLYDGIYDGKTAADEKGNYTHDTSAGSAYNDGVYYMLRHIGVEPGSYYVFPYSVINGTVVFDVNPATDTASISSYLYTVQ